MKIVTFLFHRIFEKKYKKLSPEIKRVFAEKRDLLLIDPSHPTLNNHPLHGKYSGYWSINVTGDMRAVYKIEGNVAIFMIIGTHSKLY